MRISDFSLKRAVKRLYLFVARLLCDNELDYIAGSETLPAPLTKQQEQQALKGIENGDKRSRDLLIEHNLRLVVYIARRFDNTGVGIEDLISIGTLGLIKAVNTFKPDRNIKLATYASRCIENEILMFLRKSSNRRHEISIDEPLNVDWDGNELLLSDVLKSDEEEFDARLERQDEIERLMYLVSNLDERERKILTMRFGLGDTQQYTQKQVADMLGISQSYISRLEKRIIQKLKKQFEQQ